MSQAALALVLLAAAPPLLGQLAAAAVPPVDPNEARAQFRNPCQHNVSVAVLYRVPTSRVNPADCSLASRTAADGQQHECLAGWFTAQPGQLIDLAVAGARPWHYTAVVQGRPGCASAPADSHRDLQLNDCAAGAPGCYGWTAVRRAGGGRRRWGARWCARQRQPACTWPACRAACLPAHNHLPPWTRTPPHPRWPMIPYPPLTAQPAPTRRPAPASPGPTSLERHVAHLPACLPACSPGCLAACAGRASPASRVRLPLLTGAACVARRGPPQGALPWPTRLPARLPPTTTPAAQSVLLC